MGRWPRSRAASRQPEGLCSDLLLTKLLLLSAAGTRSFVLCREFGDCLRHEALLLSMPVPSCHRVGGTVRASAPQRRGWWHGVSRRWWAPSLTAKLMLSRVPLF